MEQSFAVHVIWRLMPRMFAFSDRLHASMTIFNDVQAASWALNTDVLNAQLPLWAMGTPCLRKLYL